MGPTWADSLSNCCLYELFCLSYKKGDCVIIYKDYLSNSVSVNEPMNRSFHVVRKNLTSIAAIDFPQRIVKRRFARGEELSKEEVDGEVSQNPSSLSTTALPMARIPPKTVRGRP